MVSPPYAPARRSPSALRPGPVAAGGPPGWVAGSVRPVAKKAAGRALPRLDAQLSASDQDLVDDADITGAAISGDLSGREASRLQLTGCRIEKAQLVGTALRQVRLIDCVVTGCDLSALVLEEGACTRVEFRDCRVSGLQAAGGRFRDVAFIGCRLNGANFRMSTWERAEFENCDLVDADFYAAHLPASRIVGCDLTGAQLSGCTLAGSTLRHSVLDRLQGAEALRGVTLSGDEVLPAALALFATLDIAVDDGT